MREQKVHEKTAWGSIYFNGERIFHPVSEVSGCPYPKFWGSCGNTVPGLHFPENVEAVVPILEVPIFKWYRENKFEVRETNLSRPAWNPFPPLALLVSAWTHEQSKLCRAEEGRNECMAFLAFSGSQLAIVRQRSNRRGWLYRGNDRFSKGTATICTSKNGGNQIPRPVSLPTVYRFANNTGCPVAQPKSLHSYI